MNNKMIFTCDSNKKAVDIKLLHDQLGHANFDTVKRTANYYGIKWNGVEETCEECALAKLNRKNINKINENKCNVPGQRFYADISHSKTRSYGGNNYWVFIVDECTKIKWSYFIKNKSQLGEIISTFLESQIALEKVEPKWLRLDNSGENSKVEERCIEKKIIIQIEFTSPYTPEQNGIVERPFAYLYSNVRSMLNMLSHSSISVKALWAECAMTATFLDVILIKDKSIKSSYTQYFNREPKLVRNLHLFGDKAVVLKNEKIKAKLTNRGEKAMFIGYCPNNPHDTLRFIKLHNRQIILTRTYRWCDTTPTNQETTLQESMFDQDVRLTRNMVSESQDKPTEIQFDDNNKENVDNTDDTDTSGNDLPKTPNELRNLDYDGKTLSRFRTRYGNPRIINGVNNILVTEMVHETINEPSNFQEAWNHHEQDERERWRTAIKSEYNNMLKREVWSDVENYNLQLEKKPIGLKWVLRVKEDGTYKARLVALGFLQVPGIDFIESQSPVLHDVSLRLLLILKLTNPNWGIHQIDVEEAFLEGTLDRDIYIKFPKDMDKVSNKTNKIGLLNRSIYGLVQAARKFFDMLRTYLKKRMEMTNCQSDKCLFKNQENSLFIGVYVDDLLLVGQKNKISEFIGFIKNKFTITENDKVEKFVGCEI